MRLDVRSSGVNHFVVPVQIQFGGSAFRRGSQRVREEILDQPFDESERSRGDFFRIRKGMEDKLYEMFEPQNAAVIRAVQPAFLD